MMNWSKEVLVLVDTGDARDEAVQSQDFKPGR